MDVLESLSQFDSSKCSQNLEGNVIFKMIFEHAHAPLAFDQDLISEQWCACFLSSYVCKMIGRVLIIYLLHTVIRLIFWCKFGLKS